MSSAVQSLRWAGAARDGQLLGSTTGSSPGVRVAFRSSSIIGFAFSPEDIDRSTAAGEREADGKWAYRNHSSIIFIFPLVHLISILYVSAGQYQYLRDLPYIPPSSDPPL